MLLCFASLAVTMISGTFAVARPSAALDVLTTTAYLVMLGTATLALAGDPVRSPGPGTGRRGAAHGRAYQLHQGFGALLLLLGGWPRAGRSVRSRRSRWPC